MSATRNPAEQTAAAAADEETTARPTAEGELIEEESLIEEVSIDGMCGVY